MHKDLELEDLEDTEDMLGILDILKVATNLEDIDVYKRMSRICLVSSISSR